MAWEEGAALGSHEGRPAQLQREQSLTGRLSMISFKCEFNTLLPGGEHLHPQAQLRVGKQHYYASGKQAFASGKLYFVSGNTFVP